MRQVVKDGVCFFSKYLGIDYAMASGGKWLDEHPQSYKVIIVAAHFFRAVAMAALTAVMPYCPASNLALGLAGSVLYLITIERHCPFHFAILACFGGPAFQISKPSLVFFIDGAARYSFKAFSSAIAGIMPLVLYTVVVIAIADKEVEGRVKKMQGIAEPEIISCCCE